MKESDYTTLTQHAASYRLELRTRDYGIPARLIDQAKNHTATEIAERLERTDA